MGTSCPPLSTRRVIRAELIVGSDVDIKKTLMKYPALFALRIKSNLSGADMTVSKIRLFLSFKHSSLHFSQSIADWRTASGEFQSPNRSCAMLSGLIYTASSSQSLFSTSEVIVVFPDPLGPAITIKRGAWPTFLIITGVSDVLLHRKHGEGSQRTCVLRCC